MSQQTRNELEAVLPITLDEFRGRGFGDVTDHTDGKPVWEVTDDGEAYLDSLTDEEPVAPPRLIIEILLSADADPEKVAAEVTKTAADRDDVQSAEASYP